MSEAAFEIVAARTVFVSYYVDDSLEEHQALLLCVNGLKSSTRTSL